MFVGRLTSSFFSSTDLTSFDFELETFSANRPEGIRFEASNGELKFGDDTADGKPLVIPAGNPFLGVGFGTGGGGIDVLGEGGGGMEVFGEGGGAMEVPAVPDLLTSDSTDGVRACERDWRGLAGRLRSDAGESLVTLPRCMEVADREIGRADRGVALDEELAGCSEARGLETRVESPASTEEPLAISES
jgi:hypothetical protein